MRFSAGCGCLGSMSKRFRSPDPPLADHRTIYYRHGASSVIYPAPLVVPDRLCRYIAIYLRKFLPVAAAMAALAKVLVIPIRLWRIIKLFISSLERVNVFVSQKPPRRLRG